MDLEAGGTLGRGRGASDGYSGEKKYRGDGKLELFSRGGARSVLRRVSQRPGLSWGVLVYGAFLQFMVVALWIHCSRGSGPPGI